MTASSPLTKSLLRDQPTTKCGHSQLWARRIVDRRSIRGLRSNGLATRPSTKTNKVLQHVHGPGPGHPLQRRDPARHGRTVLKRRSVAAGGGRRAWPDLFVIRFSAEERPAGPVANSDVGRRMGGDRPRFYTLLTCGRPKQSASSRFCSHTVQAPAKPKPLRSHDVTSNPWMVRRAVWKPESSQPAASAS